MEIEVYSHFGNMENILVRLLKPQVLSHLIVMVNLLKFVNITRGKSVLLKVLYFYIRIFNHYNLFMCQNII